jgi:hypothetical protein
LLREDSQWKFSELRSDFFVRLRGTSHRSASLIFPFIPEDEKMKFEEMDEPQQEAFKSLFITALTVRTQEEQQYTQQFYRLLMLGNGTGIALLATFMGALVRNNQQVIQLRTPMIVFLVGASVASLVYLPLMSVANAATNNITTQVTEFFLNKKEVETLQGYGLNPAGRIVVTLLLFASLVLFVIGVVMCIRILGRIS